MRCFLWNAFQTAILFFALPLYALAADNADPRVTIIAKHIALREVIKKIEQQSNLRFQVNVSAGELSDPVNCNFSNAPLSIVMDSIFGTRGYTWKYLKEVIYLRKTVPVADAFPSTHLLGNDTTATTLALQVVDEKGNPVPAATIAVPGKNRGTITDSYGRAVISNLAMGETIWVTSLGFEKFKIAFNGQQFLSVRLRIASNALNEVKVVSNGFQDIPKERSTGSFEKIDTKLLNQQVGTNILDRLNGVASGVLFDPVHASGAQANIMVRGLSTINASRDPLIVVDNFVYAGDINSINPNDVLSITILKDAAASSIWGARAGNGVIVITTKKGEYNHGLKVELNSNIAIGNKPDLYSIPQMASSDMVDVQTMLFNNGVYAGPEQSRSRPVLPPAVEILIAQRDGKITADQANAQLDVLRGHDGRSDYNKYVYQPSVNQQYALSVSGGNERANYYVSGGYDHGLSTLKALSDRVSFRSGYGFKVFKKVDVKLNMNYTTSRSQNGEIGYSASDYPYRMLKDASGKELPVYKYRAPYIDTVGGGKLLDWNYYPLEDWKHSTSTQKNNDLVLGASLSYKIWRGLGVSLSYQYESQQGISRSLDDVQSFSTRDLINRFTQIDLGTGVIKYIVPRGGVLSSSNSNLVAQNIRGQLNYTNEWNQNAVSAIVGAEISNARTGGDQSRIYGYTEDPLQFTTVDILNPYPTFINGRYSYIASYLSSVSPYNITRFLSFYGNASYTYHEKYTVSISGRKDASNIFGVNTNNKWKPLWSAGLSWNLGKENFYHWDFLPVLRPRVTYGFSGNVNTGLVAKTVTQYQTGAYYTNLPYVTVSQFGDPSLRWETVGMLNIGLDFEIKRQILSGSMEYYRKKATDLYGPDQIDATAGLMKSTITRNVANMRANGVDVTLNSQNIRGVFSWTTRYLFNFYTDKITKYNNPVYASSNYVGGGSVTPIVGRPVYAVTSYKSAGLDPQTGDPRGILNGKPSEDYRAIANDSSLKSIAFNGTSLPRFNGSLSNSFTYKGISLDVNLVYKAGYKFIRSSIDYDQLFNGGAGHADFSKRWQKPGDELKTTVPSMVYPNTAVGRATFYNVSSDLLTSGAFIRLQYINLNYDLMYSLIRKSSLSQLQLYFNASNLGLVWKANKQHIDPDFPSGMPTPASFACGVRAAF
ncbi:SusC/RagA family TonB-linked outer membrane protein [Chitinophaga costaii]|uniref:SusC/RagA family TonB-linked outer membrane protein n=1 Tax=Chitinophaga costaii TaxID=1335309 RepID=UPI0013FD39A0|nr:SusC/RagA family TonB-linked outer membrane protein [Chitinophaga costaii]